MFCSFLIQMFDFLNLNKDIWSEIKFLFLTTHSGIGFMSFILLNFIYSSSKNFSFILLNNKYLQVIRVFSLHKDIYGKCGFN